MRFIFLCRFPARRGAAFLFFCGSGRALKQSHSSCNSPRIVRSRISRLRNSQTRSTGTDRSCFLPLRPTDKALTRDFRPIPAPENRERQFLRRVTRYEGNVIRHTSEICRRLDSRRGKAEPRAVLNRLGENLRGLVLPSSSFSFFSPSSLPSSPLNPQRLCYGGRYLLILTNAAHERPYGACGIAGHLRYVRVRQTADFLLLGYLASEQLVYVAHLPCVYS